MIETSVMKKVILKVSQVLIKNSILPNSKKMFVSSSRVGQIFISWAAEKNFFFGFFLVRVFPNSCWIRRDTEYLYVFSPNSGKYGPKKLRIQTLFTQWLYWFFTKTFYTVSKVATLTVCPKSRCSLVTCKIKAYHCSKI